MTQANPSSTAATQSRTQVRGPIPCLTFKDSCEEAVKFYVSLFPNSRIVSMQRSDGKSPIPEGKLLNATFELNGHEYTAFDGGPTFFFTEGASLMVTCQTQQEIDDLWQRLSEGGEPGPCGWLKDRFGLSWQIVPAALGEMLGNPAKGNSQKAMEAMLKMGKLDIAALERAYRSGA
jgi:predicted 3-demethylubiquinone-9 3-methyltransferase (glyoxalase superfamily)